MLNSKSRSESNPTDALRYTGVAQWLHWLVSALIIAQYVLAELAEGAADANALSSQLLLLANHKSLGMTVLALAFIRLLWRFGHPPPSLPATMSRWQQVAAQGAHWLIYALIFAIPLSGWLLSSAAAYSVSWFGLFQWPDLVAPHPELKEQLVNIHHWLAEALFVVVLLHVLAALKHRFIDRDGVLQGMFNRTAVAGGLAVLAASVWILGLSASTAAPSARAQTAAAPQFVAQASAATEQRAATVAQALPEWQIDHTHSEIRFTAEQAGARFEGIWQRWTGAVRFDAEQLENSSARIRIAADSANTQDADRDATLVTAEWFAAAAFPEIVFSAERFETRPSPSASENHGQPYSLRAFGTLSVKQLRVPVIFDFDVTHDGDQRTLTGAATLDRMALGLGLGEWADPDSVGHSVTVQVTVAATVATAP